MFFSIPVINNIFNYFFCRWIIGKDDRIRRPRVFLIYDFSFTLASTLAGPINAVLRLVSSLFFTLLQMYRLDVSVIAPPFQKYDNAFLQYKAVVNIYHYKELYY